MRLAYLVCHRLIAVAPTLMFAFHAFHDSHATQFRPCAGQGTCLTCDTVCLFQPCGQFVHSTSHHCGSAPQLSPGIIRVSGIHLWCSTQAAPDRIRIVGTGTSSVVPLVASSDPCTLCLMFAFHISPWTYYFDVEVFVTSYCVIVR